MDCGGPPDECKKIFDNFLNVYQRAIDKSFKSIQCYTDVLVLFLNDVDAIYSVEDALYFKMADFNFHKVTVSNKEKMKLILSTLRNNAKQYLGLELMIHEFPAYSTREAEFQDMFKESTFKFSNRCLTYQTKGFSVNEYGDAIETVLACDEKYFIEFDASGEYVRKHC